MEFQIIKMGIPSSHSAGGSESPSLLIQPSLKPISNPSGPAGYAAPAIFQRSCKQDEMAAIAKTASKVLRDPILLRLLTDRVYELMLQDLRMQQERNGIYGGSFR